MKVIIMVVVTVMAAVYLHVYCSHMTAHLC